MASEVYYMNARSESPQTGLVAKMLTVFEAAGLEQLIKPGDVVAIKIHCGEWNNTAYLRPVYPRALADRIKELGGRPFVCDTTTLTYQPYASRATELDILMTAERNGFTSAALGCPFHSPVDPARASRHQPARPGSNRERPTSSHRATVRLTRFQPMPLMKAAR